MHKWYVLQVFSSHEKKIKQAIEDGREQDGMADFIEEVILPLENVSEIVKGKQKIVEKRLWPGYLLVKMKITDDSWTYVKKVDGVIDFMGKGRPNSLTEIEVEEILTDLKQKKETVIQKHQIAEGDRVKIIDGVFVNFVGVVTKVSQEKGVVSVLVSIFGRDTLVDDLQFWQIEEDVEGVETP